MRVVQLVKWLSQDSNSAKAAFLTIKCLPLPASDYILGAASITDHSANVCILMEAFCFLKGKQSLFLIDPAV